MSLNLLEHVSLAYQPIWGVNRQVAGVRLRVRVLNPEHVDAAHLMALLENEWTDRSPDLVLSFTDHALLMRALDAPPVDGFWLEVPDVGSSASPELVDALVHAHARGHRLVQGAPLSRVRAASTAGPGQLRYLVHLESDDIHRLRVTQAPGPGDALATAGQLFGNVGHAALAAHLLDQRHAWGVCGWPVPDVLARYREHGAPVDKRVLVRVQQALMKDSTMEHIEVLIHQDPVLTYRVLRLVNSPLYGSSREVTTVRQALMLLGQRRLRDWLLELMPAAASDADLLPVRLGLVLRGRVMEHLMNAGVQSELANEIYITGLFSGLGELMNEPLTVALGRVPVSEPMLQALLSNTGLYFPYFDIARRMESFADLPYLPAACAAAGFELDGVNLALIRGLARWRNLL